MPRRRRATRRWPTSRGSTASGRDGSPRPGANHTGVAVVHSHDAPAQIAQPLEERMHGFARIITASIAVLALSACSSGSVATGGTATQGTSASQAGGGAACSTTTETTTVQAKVLDLMFDPASVTAKVGDVVTWSNARPTGHTVTLDNGACRTDTIPPGPPAT